MAVVGLRQRQALQNGGVELAVGQGFRQAGGTGDEGEELGLGEKRGDAFGDSFAAAACNKPVMDNSNAHLVET